LPFSSIDTLVDYEPYRQRGSYPIQTKRGCRHKCLYCTYGSIEGSRYRTRPPAAVVDEIEDVGRRLGNVSIELVDSPFNDPPGHAEAICREIVRRGLTVRMRTMGVNPAGVTGELIGLMREAGFSQMDCTPDSASPSILLSLKKNFTRERLETTAALISQRDMPTMWFFIFGGPGETEETVGETFDFIDRFVCKDDMVHMTAGIRINPGTGLHRVAVEQGVLDPSDSLLAPTFYVSPSIGRERLSEVLLAAGSTRPNCVNALESTPPPEMLRRALALRRAQGLHEPMFRTLLRLRRGE